MDDENEYATAQLAKLFTIPAETESPVFVVTPKDDFMTMERIQMAKPTEQILPARCILKPEETSQLQYW